MAKLLQPTLRAYKMVEVIDVSEIHIPKLLESYLNPNITWLCSAA